MDKEKAIELWQDYLTGDISTEDEQELNTYLSANPEVKTELAGLEETWLLFDQIEQPEPWHCEFEVGNSLWRVVRHVQPRERLRQPTQLTASGTRQAKDAIHGHGDRNDRLKSLAFLQHQHRRAHSHPEFCGLPERLSCCDRYELAHIY